MDMKPIAATFAAVSMLVGAAHAQNDGDEIAAQDLEGEERAETAALDRQDADELAEARMTVDEAIEVVEQMKQDEDLVTLLDQARGVLVIPDYAKVAAVVGGQGGEGVAMLRQGEGAGGEWTPPAFYNLGGASVGAEIGAQAGAVAMLLMNEEATEAFMREDDNWSLTADAGFTIVDYSTAVQASASEGDVIVWSDTEGAFAGVSVGVSDISQDEEENAAFYGESVTAREILSGNVTTDRADALLQALSE